VRRRTELERIKEKAEFLLRLFLVDAEQLEDLLLDILFVDTDGTAAQLDAVEDDVIGDRFDILDMFVVEVFGHRERMVQGFDAPLFDLEHREVDDPEEFEAVSVDQVHLLVFGDEDAEASHVVPHRVLVARTEEDDVADFDPRALDNGLQVFLFEELRQRAFEAVLFHLEVSQALCPELAHVILEAFHFALGEDEVCTRDAQRLDAVEFRVFCNGGKDLVVAAFENIDDVDHLKTVAHVRLVGAVFLHRIFVRHAREGRLDVVAGGLEHADDQLFGHGDDLFLVAEAHLDVDLGELRLAVGAEVLVTETFRDLEIAVEASDHQQLLEELRGLGQGVELAFVDPARHEVVARTFRCRFGENRRLHFEKAEFVQDVARRDRRLGAEFERFKRGSPTCSSPIMNGMGAERFSMTSSSTTTSMAPVFRRGFVSPSPRRRTVPLAIRTYSSRTSLAILCASALSAGSQTSWIRPLLSRRSIKIMPPWSR